MTEWHCMNCFCLIHEENNGSDQTIMSECNTCAKIIDKQEGWQ